MPKRHKNSFPESKLCNAKRANFSAVAQAQEFVHLRLRSGRWRGEIQRESHTYIYIYIYVYMYICIYVYIICIPNAFLAMPCNATSFLSAGAVAHRREATRR